MLTGGLSGSNLNSSIASLGLDAVTANQLTGNGTSANPIEFADAPAGTGSNKIWKWNGGAWALADDENTTYSSVTGISIAGGIIENTLPDQTVTLSSSTGLNIISNYPDFDIDLPATGNPDDVLAWNGTSWVPEAAQETDYTGLGEVNVNTVTNEISLNTGDVSSTTGVISISGDATGAAVGAGFSIDLVAGGASPDDVLTWNGSNWVPEPVPETDYTGLGDVNVNNTTNEISLNTGDVGTSSALLSITGDFVCASVGTGFSIDLVGGSASPGDVLKWDGTNWLPGNDENTTYAPGAGIDITGGVIENTAPDQTVSLSSSTGLVTGGLYPTLEVDLPTGSTNGQVLTWETATNQWVPNTIPGASASDVTTSSSAISITNPFNQVIGGADLEIDVATNAVGQDGVVPAPTGNEEY